MDNLTDFKPLEPDDEASSVEDDLPPRNADALDDTVTSDDSAAHRQNNWPNNLGYSVLSSIGPDDLENEQTRSSSGLIRHFAGHETMYGEPVACSTGFSFLQPEMIDSFTGGAEVTLKDDGFPESLTVTNVDLSQHTISGGSSSREAQSRSPVSPGSCDTKENGVLERPEFRLLHRDDKNSSLSQHSLDSDGSGMTELSERPVIGDATDLVRAFDSLIQGSTNNGISASQLKIVDAYSDAAFVGLSTSPKRNELPQFSIVDTFVGTGVNDDKFGSCGGSLPQFEVVDAVFGSTIVDFPVENDAYSDVLARRFDFSAVKIPQNMEIVSNETDSGDKEMLISAQLKKVPVGRVAESFADVHFSNKLQSNNLLKDVEDRFDQGSTGLAPIQCAHVGSDRLPDMVARLDFAQCNDSDRDLPTSVDDINAEENLIDTISRGVTPGVYDGTLVAATVKADGGEITRPQTWMPLEYDKSSDSEHAESLSGQQNANNANEFISSARNNLFVKGRNDFASTVVEFPYKNDETEDSVRLSVDVLRASIGDSLVHSGRVPIGSSTPILKDDKQATNRIQVLNTVCDSEERSDSGRASRASTVTSDLEFERADLKCSLERKLLKTADPEPDGRYGRNTMSIKDELCLALKQLSDDVAEDEIASIARSMMGRTGGGKSSASSSCTSLSPAISAQTVKQIYGDVNRQVVSSRSVSSSSLLVDSAVDFKASVGAQVPNPTDVGSVVSKIDEDFEFSSKRQEPIGAANEDLAATFPISLVNSERQSDSKKEFIKEASCDEDSDGSDVEKVHRLYQSYLDEDLESLETGEEYMVKESRNRSSETKGDYPDGTKDRQILEADAWTGGKKEGISDEVLKVSEVLVPSEKDKIFRNEDLKRSFNDSTKLTGPDDVDIRSHMQHVSPSSEPSVRLCDDLTSSIPLSGSDIEDGLSEDVKNILVKYGRRFPKFVSLHESNLISNSGKVGSDIFSDVEEMAHMPGNAAPRATSFKTRAELNCESSGESSDDTLGKRVSALLTKTSQTFGLSEKVVPHLKAASGQSSVSSSQTGSMDYDVLQRELDELEMSLDSMKKYNFGSHFVGSTELGENLVPKQNSQRSVVENRQITRNESRGIFANGILPGNFAVDDACGQMDDVSDGVSKNIVRGTEEQTMYGIQVKLLPSDKVLPFSSRTMVSVGQTDSLPEVSRQMRNPVLEDSISTCSAVSEVIAEDEMDKLSSSRISSFPAFSAAVDPNVSTRSQKSVLMNVVTKRGSSYGGVSSGDFPEVESLNGSATGVTLRRGSDMSRGSTEHCSDVELGKLESRNVGVTGIDGGDNQSSSGYSGSGSLARSVASLSSNATLAGRFNGRTARTVELESDFGKRLMPSGVASAVRTRVEIKKDFLNDGQYLIDRNFPVSVKTNNAEDSKQKSKNASTITHPFNVGQDFSNHSGYRDSSTFRLDSGVQGKDDIDVTVSRLDTIQGDRNFETGDISELEVSVGSGFHTGESSTRVCVKDKGLKPVSDTHESDSFEGVLPTSNKKSAVCTQVMSDSFQVSRSIHSMLQLLPQPIVASNFNDSIEAKLQNYPVGHKLYLDENRGAEFLNASLSSNDTLVSSKSQFSDSAGKMLPSVDPMHRSGDQSDQSVSQEDPVSSNGLLRTSLTTVTSLRDFTDSNSMLDCKGTGVGASALPVIVPYRPGNSHEVYYVDSGPEDGSHSAAVSDGTVESTHPSSDDARAPNFPVHVLGSRSDAPMDMMTQKKKSSPPVASALTNLSNISERTEFGSASKLNFLVEKTRKQELEQLREKTKNWVNGISSSSLPDMCTPLKADKTDCVILSESEFITGSGHRLVMGQSSGVENNRQKIPQGLHTVSYGKHDEIAHEISDYRCGFDLSTQMNKVLTENGVVASNLESSNYRPCPELKTLDFQDIVVKENLCSEINKHGFPLESFAHFPQTSGGEGRGSVGSKGLNFEELSSKLEFNSGMAPEIVALIEKYAEKQASEKIKTTDREDLPASQSCDLYGKYLSHGIGINPTQAQRTKPNAETFSDSAGKSESVPVAVTTKPSHEEFTKRLWDRFHESGVSSSCESESNGRRASSSVKRLVSLVQNPTQHFVKHLQSEREERSKTDDESISLDLSRSRSFAGVSMRSAESCGTYIVGAAKVRSRGLESASGQNGQGKDGSNQGQGQQTTGKDSGRLRSSGSEPGVGGQRYPGAGAGEKSSSDEDRRRQKTFPDWQEFGENVKRSPRKKENKKTDFDADEQMSSLVVVRSHGISKRAWMIVDDESLPAVPEDTVLETASSEFSQSSLDDQQHSARVGRNRFPDDPKLLKLQQQIAHQKEKYRRAYVREHRRKQKIAQLESQYIAEAGIDANTMASSLESFSRPPSVGVNSTAAASVVSENSTTCLSCSESDGSACICLRLKSKSPNVKQLIPEQVVWKGKVKTSSTHKRPQESTLVLDLHEVDYSEAGRRRNEKESSSRLRQSHAGHARQTAAESPSKATKTTTTTTKSPVRKTVSPSKVTKSPTGTIPKSGPQMISTVRKSEALDNARKQLGNECNDFGMTFPTPRQENKKEKCSKGVQTVSHDEEKSQRRSYRGSRPYDVEVISIPVTGKMRLKNPCGNLHLHGALVSNASVLDEPLQKVEMKTRSHKVKTRKPVPRGIAWFVPYKKMNSANSQKSEHHRYRGVGSDWIPDQLLHHDIGNKENSRLFRISRTTVSKETTTDFDQVTTISEKSDVLRESSLNSLNNSNSTKIISSSTGNAQFGNGEIVIPSLQQCFRNKMQAFIARSRQRETRMTLRAEERRMRELRAKQRQQLLGKDSKGIGASRKDPISEQLFKPRKRWFTKQQMKMMTNRKYRNLPEVMKMVEEKQKSEQFRANRQRVQMFKERILNHVLGEKTKRIAA